MLSIVAASDVGTLRQNNEDYFLIADLARRRWPRTATTRSATRSPRGRCCWSPTAWGGCRRG